MSAPAVKKAQSGMRQDPLSCWWKIPDRNITVQLDIKVLEHINEEIKKAAVNGVSSNEIGGLLLGTTAFDRTLQVIATECFPISCNHELGPSHRLSYADRLLLWKQIHRYKETYGESQCFVSYYRSNIADDFQLALSDFVMARDFAPDLFFFLLIQPSSPMNIGGLFFPDEGPGQSENRILFPLDRDRLLAGETILGNIPKNMPSASQDTVFEPINTQEPPSDMPVGEFHASAEHELLSLLRSSPALETATSPPRRLPWMWISVGGCLVLALIGILYMLMRPGVGPAPRPEAEIAASLELEAKVEQNQLYVKWNKAFPGIRSAKKGILSIQNGSSTQTVNLNAQALLRGDITIPYNGTQASAQLLLVSEESIAISPGGTAVNEPSPVHPESLTETAQAPPLVLGNRGGPQPQNPVVSALPKQAGALHASPPAVVSQARVLPKETERIDSGAIRPASTGPAGNSQSSSSPALSVAADARPKPQPAAAAEAPKQNQPSPPQESTQTVQLPQISTFPPSASSKPVSGAPPPALEPSPAPVVPKSVDPATLSVSSAKPKEIQESVDAFIPPRPVEAINPIVLPSGLRSQMPESMQIDIRVYVDATGAVIGAKSLSENAQISRLAVDAVRRIRFTPARRGRDAIASDLILKLKLVTEESR